jgi:hypothetical protein
VDGLLGDETELGGDEVVGFAEEGVEGFPRGSAVGGGVAGDGKSGDEG